MIVVRAESFGSRSCGPALKITRCERPSEQDASGSSTRAMATYCTAGTRCGSILAVMQTGSHRDRIIEAMRVSSRPLDDDQLADRTGISPWQSVNQICRELHGAGIVRRRPGLTEDRQ